MKHPILLFHIISKDSFHSDAVFCEHWKWTGIAALSASEIAKIDRFYFTRYDGDSFKMWWKIW